MIKPSLSTTSYQHLQRTYGEVIRQSTIFKVSQIFIKTYLRRGSREGYHFLLSDVRNLIDGRQSGFSVTKRLICFLSWHTGDLGQGCIFWRRCFWDQGHTSPTSSWGTFGSRHHSYEHQWSRSVVPFYTKSTYISCTVEIMRGLSSLE